MVEPITSISSKYFAVFLSAAAEKFVSKQTVNSRRWAVFVSVDQRMMSGLLSDTRKSGLL